MRFRPLVIVAWLLVAACSNAQTTIDFQRDVRPVLSGHCFPCHGPDAKQREARLRLDRPDDDGGTRGAHAVAAPGSVDSEFVRRLRANDPTRRMPPEQAKNPLTEDEIATLARWIAEGASYETHWAFRSVERPLIPTLPEASDARSPIDAFALEHLAQRGDTPADRTDRRTWLRRVTFDLTGLPPTCEEIERFVGDERPGAEERVVDRLLATPAYGERMTLAWMDAARYGDTSVFHADGPRTMWPWRDYVLRSYLEDKPFDRFTREQLAGDLLEDSSSDALIATGFLRNHGTSDEGGAIDEELRVSYVVDRVKTVANVWMGLTMECAQCHEHKFDPISQRTYYQFFALFNQTPEKGFQTRSGNAEPVFEAPDHDQRSRLATLREDVLAMQAAFEALTPDPDERDTWIERARLELEALALPELGPWSSIGPFAGKDAGTVFATAFGPEGAEFDATATFQDRSWTARTDLADGKVNGLGLPNNSAVYLARTLTAKQATSVRVSLGSDDSLRVWLNQQEVLARNVARGAAADQDMLDLPLREGENQLLLKIGNGGGASGVYFRLLGSSLPKDVQEALLAREPNEKEHTRLTQYYKASVWERGIAQRTRVEAATKQRDDFARAIPTVMVVQDQNRPRMTYVLDRGSYDAPRRDEPVTPEVPTFLLERTGDDPADRLDLANWLLDPRHPLTARVAVNRYWSLLFGRGLVSTTMDFGSQGDYPTHPRLLDWLAATFVERGWSVKDVLREMTLSSTYARSSHASATQVERDPDARHLARAPRFRLQGEFLRDLVLAASGLLVDTFGGEGVRPYQPPGLWNEVSLDKNVRFRRDAGAKLYRKSLYIYWKRSSPMPSMTIFDAPSREKCVVTRQRTNTPLQTLVLWNDEQFVEACRHLAARVLHTCDGSFEERANTLVETLTAHLPDAERLTILRETHAALHATFAADEQAAAAFLAVGELPRDERLDLVEHATWTALASVVTSLDETVTRE